MLGLRSREFKISARAFSVHACIHYLNCGSCDMTCTQILNLSILKAVGVLRSFCRWLNCTASSRKRCCLAYPLSLQREVWWWEYQLFFYKSQQGDALGSTLQCPCLLHFQYPFLAAVKYWTKMDFWSGWFMAGFVFIGSATLTHRWNLICSTTSIPILFPQRQLRLWGHLHL